ncbi:hypothetical protein CDR19_21210 [Ectopseudomonas toyotomiensis]|uniref:Uncharacterized protein n=1 Tax=Ectopseudomonas toyotomiensis TaxID=554344 RepID=A0A1I5XA74_9GAMM|nr:hypothetical protein [Pseudomonas toyotomiensis]PIA68488.1 hypothetical protein CDR19_21210 [Pseudomonas toyotomiensis]SFQ28547.1 hypothetical protein SAMN05216177_11086 [Pseudomonas toyotomiensis]
MPEQQNDQPTGKGYVGFEYLALGPELTETLGARPLTARELVQWLCRCQEQATDLHQLQLIADHATGVMHTLFLCWLISAAESERMVAELNAVYAVRQRALSGAAVH